MHLDRDHDRHADEQQRADHPVHQAVQIAGLILDLHGIVPHLVASFSAVPSK